MQHANKSTLYLLILYILTDTHLRNILTSLFTIIGYKRFNLTWVAGLTITEEQKQIILSAETSLYLSKLTVKD